jgi:hypothetical protein
MLGRPLSTWPAKARKKLGLVRVETATREWRGGPSADARDHLADAIDGLLRGMQEHLALEEAEVVPRIEQYGTATPARVTG